LTNDEVEALVRGGLLVLSLRNGGIKPWESKIKESDLKMVNLQYGLSMTYVEDFLSGE
jgi:hypothetical protein